MTSVFTRDSSRAFKSLLKLDWWSVVLTPYTWDLRKAPCFSFLRACLKLGAYTGGLVLPVAYRQKVAQLRSLRAKSAEIELILLLSILLFTCPCWTCFGWKFDFGLLYIRPPDSGGLCNSWKFFKMFSLNCDHVLVQVVGRSNDLFRTGRYGLPGLIDFNGSKSGQINSWLNPVSRSSASTQLLQSFSFKSLLVNNSADQKCELMN